METLDDPPSPPRTPRTASKVSFAEQNQVHVFPVLPEEVMEEAEAIATLLIEDGTPAEQQYDKWLAARLDFAGFNEERNRKPFRYGEVSPVSPYKKKRRERYATAAQCKGGHLLRAAHLARQEEAPQDSPPGGVCTADQQPRTEWQDADPAPTVCGAGA